MIAPADGARAARLENSERGATRADTSGPTRFMAPRNDEPDATGAGPVDEMARARPGFRLKRSCRYPYSSLGRSSTSWRSSARLTRFGGRKRLTGGSWVPT